MISNSLILLLDSKVYNEYKNGISEQNDTRISLIFGYKIHRKAVIKNIIEINQKFIQLLCKITQSSNIIESKIENNSHDILPSILKNIFENSELALFQKIISIVNGLPEGLVFLGFMLSTPFDLKANSAVYYDELKSIYNYKFDINKVFKFFSFYLDLFEMILLDICFDNDKKVKVISSNCGDKIDFLIKEGILDRNPIIEVKFNQNFLVSRKFYEIDFNKNIVLEYLVNSIDNLIKNSVVIYQGVYEVKYLDTIEEMKIQFNQNKCYTSKETKDLGFIVEALEEIVHETVAEIEGYSCKFKYLEVEFLQPLNLIDSENIKNKYCESQIYHLKLNTNVTQGIYKLFDTQIKTFELNMKNKIINTLVERVFTKIQNINFDNSNYNIFSFKLQGIPTIEIDGIKLEIKDINSLEEFNEVFC